MRGKKTKQNKERDDIFEQESSQNGQNQPFDKISSNQIEPRPRINTIHEEREDEEEGQILSDEHIIPEESEIKMRKQSEKNLNLQNYDSSSEDEGRLEKEKKKREQFWKFRHQNNQMKQSKEPLTEEQARQMAFAALERTNKRVMLMRKKNEKRMDDLEKIRMAQQPYLTTSNTHFRGSSSEYAIITHDGTGKSLYHPNFSLKVGEMRLQNFIQKNIKQESTSNYLNEVVKFQNYAYQKRKKRRHNHE